VKFTHINRVIHQNRGADDTEGDDNLRLMTPKVMTTSWMTAKPMTAERMTPKVMTICD